MANLAERTRRPAPQQRRAEGLSAGGFLLAAFLTCAFGVGVVVAGYFWMAQPKALSPAVLSATGRIEQPTAPTMATTIDDRAWTDADIRGCSEEATAAADIAAARKLAAVSADRVGLGGPDSEMVESSTYLLCGATRKRLHLCDAYWRGWFIEAIKQHAVAFRKVSSSAYWTKVELAGRVRSDAANQGAWQTISDDVDQTTREVATMHDEIAAAFRALIADGIISPDEFGVFLGYGIPSDIAAMIGDAQPLRKLCG